MPQQVGNGGVDGGCHTAVGAAIAMQSVRMFLKSAVVKGFLKLGFMKLGGVVVWVHE